MDLSIIVPCYNEEGSLPLLLAAVTGTFAETGIDYEVILVDDGSSDGTAGVIDRFVRGGAARHATFVSFSRNFGKEPAMLAGLEHASGDCMSFIDADLQQDPRTLLEMYRFLIDHDEYDCVAAYQERRRENALRSWAKRHFYKTFNSVSSTNLEPDASDFRVFRHGVADAVLSLPEYYRFTKGIFAWIGFRTYPFPYTPDDRAEGESKWSFKSLMSYAMGGMMSFSTLPLRLASWVGAVASAAGLVYFVFVLVDTYVLRNTPAGYPTIVCLLLLLGGLILLTLGIIGEYLARMYIEGKRRPIYIADRVVSVDGGRAVESGTETNRTAAR